MRMVCVRFTLCLPSSATACHRELESATTKFWVPLSSTEQLLPAAARNKQQASISNQNILQHILYDFAWSGWKRLIFLEKCLVFLVSKIWLTRCKIMESNHVRENIQASETHLSSHLLQNAITYVSERVCGLCTIIPL